MKREPQSLTEHLRHAAHRIHRAAWIIDSGASALHCGRVLALTRGKTGKIRKLFFSDSMAFEDKATVLRRNLSATDRQTADRGIVCKMHRTARSRGRRVRGLER
jgi:hypothetical protein